MRELKLIAAAAVALALSVPAMAAPTVAVFGGSDGSQVSSAVPAPGALALLGLGLAGIGAMRRRKSTQRYPNAAI